MKRKFEIAFESASYDDQRYGQRIDPDYFVNHHATSPEEKIEDNEVYKWCLEYLKSKDINTNK